MSKMTEARDEEYNGYKYETIEEAKKARAAQLRKNQRAYYYRKKLQELNENPEEMTPTGEKIIENQEGNSNETNMMTEILKDLGIDQGMTGKILKYLPAALQLIQGLQKKTSNQNTTQETIPQMPVGYGTLKALDYKNDPVWQAQARKYREYHNKVISGEINLDGSHDPTFRSNPVRQPPQMESHLPKPNWEETNKESLEKTMEGESVTPKEQEEAVFTSSTPSVAEETLMKEITEQLKFLTTYLNSMKDEDFLNWITKEEEMKAMIKKAPLNLFPALVNTLKTSTGEQLMQVIKEACPEKYELLKNKRKIKKGTSLLEELRQML